MSASLSFGALMIDESSTNMQVHQEQMAQKVCLYPDNDLYACLEFEYNAAEARRNAAKQLYRTYLESDGQYQSVVNEAGAGAAVAGVVAIIAACIALVIKLFARKTGNDIDTTINQLKAMNQSLARKNDTIQTDDPHYNDEMTIRMPDVSLFAINSIGFHLDLIVDSDAQTAMIELSGLKDESKIKEIVEHFRERITSVIKNEDSNIRKLVYGDPESATFTMIDESGPAGELYNKYISKYASKIVGFGDDFDKFIKESQKIVKDLEARKSRVSSWGASKDGDSKAVADAKAEILKAYGDGIQSLINVYGKHGMAIKGAMKRVSQVVLQFQRKFNRIDDETRRKLYKMSEAAFDNVVGEASLMEESSPLHYSSINTQEYVFGTVEDPIKKESAEPFGGLFSVNEESFIHGEPFDGDTLYDEKDYQDFNRTDWVNLGLGEHYKDLENQSRIEEAAFKQECLYRSQPGFSFEKLQKLNEEVAETSKKGWARAMDTLKQLIQKFIEKLYGAFGSNKPYLDRYKKSIIDGQTPAVPFTSTGDIFVGMDRIMNVGVPLLNYQQMKNDLGDQGTFYAKHILPEFAKGKNGGRWSRFMKRNFQYTSDGKGGVQINIAGDSKEYFGYGNENNKNEWQLSDLTKDDWQEIFNWLYDVKKIRDSIKKDQRTIEDSIRRIDTELKKAQKLKDDAKNGTGEKPNTEVSTDPKQADVQPQQNAAYSYVYGRMFMEAEIGDAPAASGGGNAAPQATNTTGKGYNDTNAAMKDINSTNPDSTEAVRTAMNNYLAVVKAVLTAKMSALEFIRKELFQIVRYKVQFNQRQNGQQPAQGQQQTQQTQQQQTTDNGNRQNRKR